MQVLFSLGKQPSLDVWLFQIVALEIIIIINIIISTTNNSFLYVKTFNIYDTLLCNISLLAIIMFSFYSSVYNVCCAVFK